jgi:hypothetical protein
LWIGYRQNGYEVVTGDDHWAMAKDRLAQLQVMGDPFANSLLPLPTGQSIVGCYGESAVLVQPREQMQSVEDVVLTQPREQMQLANNWPAGAKAPTEAELTQMLARVKPAPANDSPKEPAAQYVSEDWMTQGDWVGRYGRLYTTLCATNSPYDHIVAFDVPYAVRGSIGPNRTRDDALRAWIHWKRSGDPRVLYNPYLGYRRQAEWDDHGEAYPMAHEGPDLWAKVSVPEGVHRITLYFFNKDGHARENRFRDYMLTLRPWLNKESDRLAAPIMAQARVRDFWGGAHKSFVVTGPAEYAVSVAKNGSFNTILSSIMLDKLQGPRIPDEDDALPYMCGVRYDPPEFDTWQPRLETAWTRWSEGRPQDANAGGVLLYRAAAAKDAPPDLLANWRWTLRLWTEEDRKSWAAVVRFGRETFARINNVAVEKGY